VIELAALVSTWLLCHGEGCHYVGFNIGPAQALMNLIRNMYYFP